MKMRISTPLALAAIAAMALVAGAVRPAAPRPAGPVLVPQAIEAPERAFTPGRPVAAPAACVTPPPVVTSAFIHCYTPAQIRAAYGVDRVANRGAGQTIVLVDAYGSPTAAHDLQVFHDTFFPDLPSPKFDQVFPLGAPNFHNIAKGNGLSGPSAALLWAEESTLDIEWSYAIAPLAHIVLLATPPARCSRRASPRPSGTSRARRRCRPRGSTRSTRPPRPGATPCSPPRATSAPPGSPSNSGRAASSPRRRSGGRHRARS